MLCISKGKKNVSKEDKNLQVGALLLVGVMAFALAMDLVSLGREPISLTSALCPTGQSVVGMSENSQGMLIASCGLDKEPVSLATTSCPTGQSLGAVSESADGTLTATCILDKEPMSLATATCPTGQALSAVSENADGALVAVCVNIIS